MKLSEDMDKQVFECGKKVQDSICSIYSLDGSGNPQLTGTAILLNINNYYFLISAAHVLSDNGQNLFFPYNKDLHGIGGINHSTSLTFLSSRDEDKIDISIFELDSNIRDKFLSEYKFFQLNDIELNHINKSNRVYFGMGFPGDITTVNTLTKKISENKYIFWSLEAEDEKYSFVDCKKHSHILVKFMNNKYYYENTDKIAPSPFGMSGGGLWYMKNIINPDIMNIDFKLVGIQIEYHKWADVVVAIKFHLVTEALRILYKELNDYLPKCTIADVSINIE